MSLSVGDTFTFKLGDDYLWQIQIGDERVAARVPGLKSEASVLGLYEARAVGKTDLQIAGDPLCLNASPPCGLPSLLFQLTITIR